MVVEYEDGVDHDDTYVQVDYVTGLVQDSDITRAWNHVLCIDITIVRPCAGPTCPR